eukprot:361493-Chlamydomonas_euryale.AAC.1
MQLQGFVSPHPAPWVTGDALLCSLKTVITAHVRALQPACPPACQCRAPRPACPPAHAALPGTRARTPMPNRSPRAPVPCRVARLCAQWPLVQKFRPQILDAVGSLLASDAALSTPAAADALAAAALLQGLDSSRALEVFLAARQECLAAALAAPVWPPGDAAGDAPGGADAGCAAGVAVARLSHVVQALQTTFLQ